MVQVIADISTKWIIPLSLLCQWPCNFCGWVSWFIWKMNTAVGSRCWAFVGLHYRWNANCCLNSPIGGKARSHPHTKHNHGRHGKAAAWESGTFDLPFDHWPLEPSILQAELNRADLNWIKRLQQKHWLQQLRGVESMCYRRSMTERCSFSRRHFSSLAQELANAFMFVKMYSDLWIELKVRDRSLKILKRTLVRMIQPVFVKLCYYYRRLINAKDKCVHRV